MRWTEKIQGRTWTDRRRIDRETEDSGRRKGK